ncbi:MAG: transcription termination/antitermination NusG family protein [Gemmataceae bacterium]|nr:hypothetical protein [Gemmata sp.]MDW8198570.1 transcription termination/antitermination NusG family protein [Gemmataceae bacterium]
MSEPLAAAATSGPAEVPQEPTATHGAAEAAADSMEVSVRSEFTQKVPEQPAPVQDEPAEPSTAVAATPPESPAKPKRTRKKAATSEPVTAAVAEAPAAAPSAPVPVEEPPPENKKKWYAIKVQSGREDTIKAAILRKVAIEGLEQYVGQIVIPVEEVVEKKMVRIKDKKTGEYTTQERKVTKKKKKFHGYIFAELEFNDRILYLFRETSGVGDFLNMRGKPPVPEPMPEHEVQSMLTGITVKDPLKRAKFKLDFEKGDRVRIREGSFINNEGEVKEISEVKDPTDTPKVKVELTFWGRPLEVELDASQVEKI